MIVGLAATGGILFGFIRGMATVNHVLIWPMFVLFFPVIAMTIGAMVTLGEQKDPEKIIEGELQGCVRKHNES